MFVRYCLARYRESELGKAYQTYMADRARQIEENTARYAGGGYIKTHWSELIDPKPCDARTGEEIAADVIRRAGLVVMN